MRNTASTIGGRDAQSLDFLDGMLDAMERESGLVVVGDGGFLTEGEIGPVQRAAGGRPVPGARLRATHPAHVGGKRAGFSSARASCFITPAHRTNSPAAAMCPTKLRNVCSTPGLSRS